jgi:endonuclease III
VNLVHHGRACCIPVEPRCTECILLPYCPTGQMRILVQPINE